MPTFGMFGGLARRAMQSPRAMTPEERAALLQQQTQAQMPTPSPRPLIGGGMPQPKQNGIMGALGYDQQATGMSPFEWFVSPQSRVDNAKKSIAAQQAAAAQERQMMEMARNANLDPGATLALFANREKFGESYATNYGAANVGAGDSRVFGNGTQAYRAPQNMMNVASDAAVFNPETSGQVYKNTPSPKPPEPFTLNQGDVRFDANGKRIAGVAPRPDADGGYKPPPGFASLPGGKLDYIPGGPADPAYIDQVSDARARGVPEFSQTEQRQYKSKVTALNEFEAGLNDYFRVLEENGGPQTIEGFWNAQQRKNIDAAHALMTLNLKQAYQGGALDKGLIEIAEKILTDPTGWSSLNGGGAAEFRKAAEPIYNNINYARSQIPETFRGGAQQPGALKAGTVEDGYRFKGGAPDDPANWEQVR